MTRKTLFAAVLLLAGAVSPAAARGWTALYAQYETDPWGFWSEHGYSPPSPYIANADSVTYDDFQLFTGCSPVRISTAVDDDDNNLKLGQDRLETAVRSRLRGARIYADESYGPALLIYVHVVGKAFNYSLDLNLRVWRDGLGWWTTNTWHAGGTGTHGGDASYVLGHISQSMDTFIDEYLRVNGEACDKQPASG